MANPPGSGRPRSRRRRRRHPARLERRIAGAASTITCVGMAIGIAAADEAKPVRVEGVAAPRESFPSSTLSLFGSAEPATTAAQPIATTAPEPFVAPETSEITTTTEAPTTRAPTTTRRATTAPTTTTPPTTAPPTTPPTTATTTAPTTTPSTTTTTTTAPTTTRPTSTSTTTTSTTTTTISNGS